MRTPKGIDIDITNRCNLRCRYCYHFESAGDGGGDLPPREWIRFFGELNRCAVTEVTMAGGEPFIRKDLKEIIGGIVSNRMRFSILSNGTLIDDDMAAFLSATGRCNTVQVSIDGSVPVTHDSMRGRGSFVKAAEGIRTLQRHNVPVAVRVTIHRKNVHDLESVARLLLDDLGLSGFSTNSASYMGLCRKNAEMVQLTVGERTLAMETLMRLNERYDGRIQAMAGPLAEAQHWSEMERARRKGLPTLPGGGALTGCGCIFQKMGVRSDGVMVPCTMLSHIELGRINQDDLREVWQGHEELRRLRARSGMALSEFSFCEGCPYTGYCAGNCPGVAFSMMGDPYHPAPDACLRRFLEEGGRLPEMEHCA